MREIRPGRLPEFTGQDQLVRDLNVLLGAAKRRNQCPDHILLAGPPGLGKTTLAGIVAAELGLPFVATSAPAIAKPGDLLALLTGIKVPSVVFVDEIHALDRKAEELLYTAMEDGHVDMIIGEGMSSRTVRIDLAPFTLIGATTQMGSLSGPLRDRFGFLGRLLPYDATELARIVTRSAGLLGIGIEADAALTIAGRSRGTPRVANRWLRRVRDWAETHDKNTITGDDARTALEEFGIDELGLDPLARDILQTACANFGGGPVGIATLASAVGEAESTIVEVYETHLMREGLIMRTRSGRVVTEKGWRHLGLIPPAAGGSGTTPTLFVDDPDNSTGPDDTP
jgi:Holliday junction DNA helicase RuvB